jgi:hypothetical protein
MYQHAPEMALARMWEMYLRGVPKTRIAMALGIERHTVARHLRAMYREVAEERKSSNARKLDMAVARMRLVEVQAWADHDADDGGQRSRHLRLVLDVEREIARLEGLYEVALDDGGGEVVFTIRRLEPEVAR